MDSYLPNLDNLYPGLSGIDSVQCVCYGPMMTSVAAEVTLVQVKSAGDVAAVKSILQARVDTQVAGGAWYPATIEQWENNSRIVSKGNCVMLIVSASCDDIVKDFNAKF